MVPFPKLLDYLNIHAGDLIYIQSSYSRMKMFGLQPIEIIEQVVERVGMNGTVVFPSFSWNIEPMERPWKGYKKYFSSDILFDVCNTKSNIGYLSEVFRVHDGVIRSAHPFWSISAIGSLAKTLTARQESVDEPYGPTSSFGIMRDHHVKIIGFGVTLNTTSLCPIVDYDLGLEHTQYVFTKERIKAKVIDVTGKEVVCATFTMLPEAVRYIQPSKVFEKSQALRERLIYVDLQGSFFFSYDFSDYYNAAIKLGYKAIRMKQKVPWLELLPLKNEVH